MLTLADTDKFIKSIEKCGARELSKSRLIERFLEFMKIEYNLDHKYFDNKFENYKEKYSNFEDFIYGFYLHLEKDLRRSYEYYLKQAKERVKYYKEKVNYFNKKVMETEDYYDKAKLKFYLALNSDYYEKANKERESKNIFYKAYKNSLILNPFKSSFNYDSMLKLDVPYLDWEQFEDFDWKLMINFSIETVGFTRAMGKLKLESLENYLLEFKNYINSKKIFEKMELIAENNYYINKRLPIIKTASDLFNAENYTPLVYLLVTQVEGLFDDYRQILDIKVGERINGIENKLEKLREEKKIAGYVYYAFDFPKLRNNIAHGKMIEVTNEMTFDIIMDIFYIVMLIDSKENAYKIWAKFLKDMLDYQNKYGYILEFFKETSIYGKQYFQILEDYFDGKYNDIIKWYGLEDNEKTLLDIFKSEAFRKRIFDNAPIEIEKKEILDGKEYKIININKDVCQYAKLIEILQKKDFFPEEWVSAVEKRMQEIKEKEEEKNEKIDRILKENREKLKQNNI